MTINVFKTDIGNIVSGSVLANDPLCRLITTTVDEDTITVSYENVVSRHPVDKQTTIADASMGRKFKTSHDRNPSKKKKARSFMTLLAKSFLKRQCRCCIGIPRLVHTASFNFRPIQRAKVQTLKLNSTWKARVVSSQISVLIFCSAKLLNEIVPCTHVQIHPCSMKVF